jgi:hypothetical protein
MSYLIPGGLITIDAASLLVPGGLFQYDAPAGDPTPIVMTWTL